MSMQRSPQSKESPVGPAGSHSQPDLSRPHDYDTENQVTFRNKRQRDCNCECNQVVSLLKAFRNDMISVLENNLKPMRDDVSTVKHQMNDIKCSTEKLLAEHKSMKEEINKLQKASSASDTKISTLETEIAKLKTLPLTTQPLSDIFENEKIISEMQERERRGKNFILVGLPEPTNTDYSIRQNADLGLVQKTLSDYMSIHPEIVKVIRLGNYFTGKTRPLKVCLKSTDEIKQIFMNKIKLPENIRIYHDQTPTEKNVLKELNKELTQRKENGEADLIIRYIRGTPKIVPASKNLNEQYRLYKEKKKDQLHIN